MSDYTTPILYTLKRPGTPRPWLMSETPALFSLANIGSYNQRLVNQLLSVCSELSHHVSFLPILSFLSLRDMEHRETLYANGQPFVHTATLEGVDIYDRQPSAAETTLVGEMLATIRYYQAVPVLSYSIITSMLRRCMDELETCSDAAGCLIPEVDKHGKPQWNSYSETATYYGLSGDSRSNGENEFDNSYKLHFLEGDLVSVLNNGGSISTLISDDYVWIVSTANNNAIRVDDVNGKWEVLGYSTPSSKNSTTDLIQMDTLITNLSTFSTDQNAVTELICFEAPMYHTNFVYMNTPDGEVLIPYGSRPDLTGLENGKVYTTQEVSDILADSFSGFYPADANGGPASQSGFYPTDTNGESASQTGMISPSVLIATVILLLTGGCVLFLIRRRVIR